jgi:signal transduction histidine kinase
LSEPRRFRLITLLRVALILSALVLYLAACLIIFGFQVRQSRTDLHYFLYSEAESLASYIATTGKLDFPELVVVEEDKPTRVWLRVVEDGRAIAETPGFPQIALAGKPEVAGVLGRIGTGEHGAHDDDDGDGDRDGDDDGEAEDASASTLLTVTAADGARYPLVRHVVWNRDDTYVEALTVPQALQIRLHRQLAILLLTGLILVPLIAAMSEVLSRQLQKPIEDLIASIHRIDTDNLAGRLREQGRVTEIYDLAEAFNGLLDRVEGEVRRMRRFTANASHELRTPVASLRAGIDVCLRRPRPAEEYRTVLEESLLEIDRVQRVVEGLLALARERDGAVKPPVREPVELADLIEKVSRILQPLADAKEIQVLAAAEPNLVVPGDPSQLELLLINLVDNAIRHGPRHSQVRVDATRQGDKARILVTDQGPGIAKAERTAIFERHFQGRQESRSPRAGGIGLDLVSWVVQVHRGRVRVLDDDEPGAKFEILLPADPGASHL